MKRYFLLAAVSVSVGLFGTSACKKDVPAAPEAGAVAEPEAEAGPAEAETAAAPEEDAAPAATLSAAPTPVATAAKVAAKTEPVKEGGPFQGTYKCFGNMKVTQKGNSVEVRTFPGKQDGYSTISCNASGDVCTGTVTEFKGGAAAGKRGAVLTRSGAGDITYKGDGETKATFCKKQ
ncbi:MAG: hypothetical protein KIT84_03440 [Labilithrix sp.]|nr:hypothetical protein [Labilithrix sp.]MCW5810037.1 hypothetical protein [Labilithrix sp.]